MSDHCKLPQLFINITYQFAQIFRYCLFTLHRPFNKWFLTFVRYRVKIWFGTDVFEDQVQASKWRIRACEERKFEVSRIIVEKVEGWGRCENSLVWNKWRPSVVFPKNSRVWRMGDRCIFTAGWRCFSASVGPCELSTMRVSVTTEFFEFISDKRTFDCLEICILFCIFVRNKRIS